VAKKHKMKEGKLSMKTLGNIIWFIFGGFWGGLGWIAAGLLWSITIVGIPVGLQCFKFAKVSFWPFGKEIVYSTGTGSFLLNIVWIIFSGIPLAIGHLLTAILLFISIIGIPFAAQSLKLARLALTPFGAKVMVRRYAV
jgi:uncharacterized membrane protein YccF (DUF307 family)